MNNNKWNNYFKNVVLETAKLSTCASKQVGALLVKNNRILAIAYNGVPSTDIHCTEIFQKPLLDSYRTKHHEWSLVHELHAEQNLIAYCAKHGIPTFGCEIWITLSPCTNCAKLIYASGIITVNYITEYDLSPEGLTFLLEHKIKIIKHDIEQ